MWVKLIAQHGTSCESALETASMGASWQAAAPHLGGRGVPRKGIPFQKWLLSALRGLRRALPVPPAHSKVSQHRRRSPRSPPFSSHPQELWRVVGALPTFRVLLTFRAVPILSGAGFVGLGDQNTADCYQIFIAAPPSLKIALQTARITLHNSSEYKTKCIRQ